MHFAAWFRREDYERIREIMDDGNKLPVDFDEWEDIAKGQLASAERAGIIIKPVTLDPDEFIAFCKTNKIPRDGESRSKFVIDRGLAKSSH